MPFENVFPGRAIIEVLVYRALNASEQLLEEGYP